ncbi:DUF6273 domain-containing protein [Confluentibacter citreus]|uniref:DUF6273 domain-containing protein n=1 Tax=Confluentibacter citreus TaxID=2007307 RepID=UPI000C2860A2|nr:DUF6273 domain-containing protein [Confluentibacter citreus]
MKRHDILNFGNHIWQVLDIKDDRILIITKDIIELQWYHKEFIDITWEECELRRYLNNEFFNTFNLEEKEKILSVENSNLDNQWFKTKGGANTADKIFLLSLREVCEYFGDSIENLKIKGKQKWLISDENDLNRKAKYNNIYHWWRLRSPGYYGRTSASVNSNGNVYIRGNGIYGKPKDSGGIRPALWLNLKDIKN